MKILAKSLSYTLKLDKKNISFHFHHKRFIISNIKNIKVWLNQIAHIHGYSIKNFSINFLSDNQLLEMNNKYLNHNYYTDIITFNYSQNDEIFAEIFISIDRVKDNAKSNKLDSYIIELKRVMAHGLLHCMNFNDRTNKQKAQMRQKENESLLLYNKLFK